MDDKLKVYYFLITGEIVFTDEDENVNAVRINGVIANKDQTLPAKILGKSQQILQVNFMQKMGEEKVRIVDVVLTNFTLLGLMTQAEFHAAPEGTQVQEKQAANDEPIPVPTVDIPLEDAVAAAGDVPMAPSTEGAEEVPTVDPGNEPIQNE